MTARREMEELAAVESYLRDLIGRCDGVPLLADVTEADLRAPRGTASIARAALAWLRDGSDQAIRQRYLDDRQFNDRFAAWRLRMISNDLAEAEDWVEVANSIGRARRARAIRDAGYSQAERTPDPWPAEDLDPATWREVTR